MTGSSGVKSLYCEANLADALAVVGHFLGVDVHQQVLGKAFTEITAVEFDAFPPTGIAAVDSQSVSSPAAAAPTSPNVASGLPSQPDRTAATRDARVLLDDYDQAPPSPQPATAVATVSQVAVRTPTATAATHASARIQTGSVSVGPHKKYSIGLSGDTRPIDDARRTQNSVLKNLAELALPGEPPGSRPAKRARTSSVLSVASSPAASSAEQICDCGLPVTHRLSKTQKNPDRPYMCCQNSKPPGARGPVTSCKFFQWSDEAPAAAVETRDITISCTIQRVEPALITKAEHDGALALLRAVDWTQVRNTTRKNVIPAGEDFCHSISLGPNMFQQPPQPSASSLRYPILERCLRSLVAVYDQTFLFTNITINHNLVCKPHRDTGNIGNSLIIAFGDYTDGQLAIEDTQGLCRAVDIKNRFVRFNGAKNEHWTLPFTGERYSAVFYTHRNAS